MRAKEDIEPRDKNDEHHGYQEWYYHNGNISLRGKWIHGDSIGYQELHRKYFDSETNFYIR